MIATKIDGTTKLQDYINRILDISGSDLAVGKFLGLADGSRVGMWRKGSGRPSELMCIKLARWHNHDPLEVLKLAGYEEMAELLSGAVPEARASNIHSVKLLQNQLTTLKTMIELALTQIDTMGVDSDKNETGRRVNAGPPTTVPTSRSSPKDQESPSV
jgi:hypothetical protein